MNSECDECDAKFRHNGSLKIHLRIHSDDCDKCDECGKEFTLIGNLEKHMKVHIG